MVRVINARTDSVDYLMLVTNTPKKLLKHYTRHLEEQGFHPDYISQLKLWYVYEDPDLDAADGVCGTAEEWELDEPLIGLLEYDEKWANRTPNVLYIFDIFAAATVQRALDLWA